MSLIKQKASGLFDKKKIKNAKENLLDDLKRDFDEDLRTYQTFPGYYLKKLATEQKGLLINHLMGTGKTFTGINFMTDYYEKKVIVVCYSFMNETWISEVQKLGLNKININFMSYDEFIDNIITVDATTLDDYILLIDDGHNLIYKIRNQIDDQRVYDLYNKTKFFHKILFLSGTPFYNDEYDIIYIMNLVSGKELLPFNKEEFDKEYFKVSKIKSAFFGWIQPLLDSKVTFLAILGTFIGLYIDSILNMVQINKEMSDTTIKTEDLQNEIDNNADKPGFSFIKKYLNAFGLRDTQDTNLNTKEIVTAGILFTISIIVLYTVVKLIGTYDLNKIKDLDTKKLSNKIQNYISYYEVKNTKGLLYNLQVKKCHSDIKDDQYFLKTFCNGYLDKLNESNYPSKKLIIKNVEYTLPQMQLFLKGAYNKLTRNEIINIGVKTNYKQRGVFFKLSDAEFLDYGRSIGNLTLKDENNNIFIPKKFNEILNISDNKQTVIYSNFYDKGLVLFAKFLLDNKQNYAILDDNLTNNKRNDILNKFKNKEIQYLLLHPRFIDGINIWGAEQLHILEPLDMYSKFDQLMYRVIRFNSHTHLPVKERKVEIYQWVTKSMSLIDGIIQKYKSWKKFSSHIAYWRRLTEFDDNLSPDSIIHNKNGQTSKIFTTLSDSIKKYNIESCSLKNKNFNCNLEYSYNSLLN
jgi:superfamily II DNA or RNA helicase